MKENKILREGSVAVVYGTTCLYVGALAFIRVPRFSFFYDECQKLCSIETEESFRSNLDISENSQFLLLSNSTQKSTQKENNSKISNSLRKW